jgi:hypothetical protein
MDRLEVRAQARELLDLVYMTAAEEGGRAPGAARLAELARAARDGGAPLDRHSEGPWRSDRCRFAHTAGTAAGETAGPSLTCVMRGEFELPLPEAAAPQVAALLNWAEVPEPGAQT